MKTLKYFIDEALIGKNTKLNTNIIKINIDKDSYFTEEEIQKIEEFANRLKVPPYAITNKYYDHNIVSSEINLYLVYTKDYLTKNYSKDYKYTYSMIMFSKFFKQDIPQVYICEVNDRIDNYIRIRTNNTLEDLFNTTLDKLKQIIFFSFKKEPLDY